MEDLPLTYAAFQGFLHQGRLMGTRCRGCGAVSLPPRSVCRRCQMDRLDWVEMPTQGRLVAFTCIHVGRSFTLAEGFDRDHPYCVGVVELENGVRLTARITGVDAAHPEQIRIDSPVRAEFFTALTEEGSPPALAFRVI